MHVARLGIGERFARIVLAAVATAAMLATTGCASFGGHGRSAHHHHHSRDTAKGFADIVIGAVWAIGEVASLFHHSHDAAPAPVIVASDPAPAAPVDPAPGPPVLPDARPAYAAADPPRNESPEPGIATSGRLFSADDAGATLRIAASYAARCRGGSHGPVEARVVYDVGGGVADIAVAGPGVADPSVAACVRGRLRQARVLAYDGPRGVVTTRFDVAPPGAAETASISLP